MQNCRKNEIHWLIGLCTFRSTSFKIGLQEKEQQLLNLMYIMLLKVCCSSFSAVTACTFDWLTAGRSLIKTKLNCLINSICLRVWSITEKMKHGNYSVKVRSEKYSTWYMKAIWKIHYKFADAKINWFTWWYLSWFTSYCTLSISYRKRRHILISVINSRGLHSRFVGEELCKNFLWIILVWFC